MRPGVCAKRCQMLGPAPSASGEPSIWYAEVAQPHRKSFGKMLVAMELGSVYESDAAWLRSSCAAVRKVYPNGHVAIDDATFDIRDGELLVLVGPSGCGKSTLLRLIAGLEEASAGTILIGERDVTHLEPRDRDIAMVFQSYALYPHMTVARNLGFGLELRGHRAADIEQRVKQAAETLELTQFMDRLPRQLSGGQRQRVALGRALVRHPQVFLLDEPLSNLDAKLRASTRAEIARLHRTLGTTMIYVTHDQVEAMTLGQRIVVLDRGRHPADRRADAASTSGR